MTSYSDSEAEFQDYFLLLPVMDTNITMDIFNTRIYTFMGIFNTRIYIPTAATVIFIPVHWVPDSTVGWTPNSSSANICLWASMNLWDAVVHPGQ